MADERADLTSPGKPPAHLQSKLTTASPSIYYDLDGSSPMYPERAIRPLPKRRVRSRPSNESSIFASGLSAYLSPTASSSSAAEASSPGPISPLAARPKSLEWAKPTPMQLQSPQEASAKPKIPSPTAKALPEPPSAEGFDSFEITSNKKKRKVPTSGGNSANLAAEMAMMGLADGRVEIGSEDVPSVKSHSSRARHARRNLRTPLASVHGSNCKPGARGDLLGRSGLYNHYGADNGRARSRESGQ